MTAGIFRKAMFAGSVALAIGLLAGQAQASRLTIDSGTIDFAPCVLGSGSCAGIDMPFSANFGTGAFSKVYVYSNGLVSFGSEISAAADLSSLASIGGNVFTAGYSPTMTLSSPFQLQNPSVAFAGTGILANKPVFRIRYLASFGTLPESADLPMQFSIFDVGSGQYALQLQHGSLSKSPDIAPDSYLGYSFGGAGVQVSGATLRTQVQSGTTDFEYFFGGTGGAVPEPASWMMLIAGFGLVGSSLRRQRGHLQAV
jgi:hypothetical protein